MDHIFDENQPIYLQIKQRICAMILRGDYQAGGKLPGVVEAAMQYRVNHNTIQRVYQELIHDGVAVTRRGEGTFVTEDRAALERLEAQLRDSFLESFVTEMTRLGYQTKDLPGIVQTYVAGRREEV